VIVDIEIDSKKYKATVPDDAPKNLWNAGIIIGPPDLSGLELPPIIEVRLHNELFNRGLITELDVRKRASEVFAALQSALRVDSTRVLEAYQNGRRNQ
jgi:hypothetical protein